MTPEESGENPKQMRYRDCRKASVGNSFFIDRDDPTQSGSDHIVLQHFLELLSKAFLALMGVFLCFFLEEVFKKAQK